MHAVYFLSALGSDDDVELESAVDWCCESARVFVVGATYVGHNSVEHDVGVLSNRSDVVGQAHKERNATTFSRRHTYAANTRLYVSVFEGVIAVADLEGDRAGSAPPPLGDGLTPSLTVMLANGKF